MKRIVSKRFFAGIVMTVFLAAIAPGLGAQTVLAEQDNQLVNRYKRANPQYLDGEKQFLRKKMDKAEKKFLECLAIMPEHSYASYGLARIYLLQGELALALEAITTAKKNYVFLAQFQTFTHQEYLNRLRNQRQGLEEQRNNILQRQLPMPTKGAVSSPDNISTMNPVLTKINQDIELIDRNLASPVPDAMEIPADFFFINGNILFKMGSLAAAIDQYLEAIRIDPLHSNSYNNLAAVYFAAGKYREALEWITRAEAAGSKVNPKFKEDVEKKVSALKPE